MTKLLDDKQYFNLPKVGELIKARVISANKNEVYLDIAGVATGVVRGRERYDESEQYKNLNPDDEVEATVLEIENENGEMELSFQYAGRQRAWQSIKEHEKVGTIVPVTIIDANKGGLMVRVENTIGFLPVSQLAPEHYPRVPGGDKNRILEILKSYVGQKFEAKVIDANEQEDKLILSEKTAWEETQKDVINKYKVGDIVEGVVTAITDFGVFVEFSDKLEGLIHISEIAWQRIEDPNDFVKVGQQVKAEIIGIQNSKIFLSMKKLIDDPWQHIEEKYTIGQKVSGKVIKVNPFGLFVELDEQIHGLAHISQLSDKPVADLNTVANIGDTMEFYIVSMDPKNHRLGLSLMKPKAKKEKKDDKPGKSAPEDASADDAELFKNEEVNADPAPTEAEAKAEETPAEEVKE